MQHDPKVHSIEAFSNYDRDGHFIYNALFEKIKEEYGDAVFSNWFSHIKFKSFAQQKMTLSAPSAFVREWVITNYFAKIYKILDLFHNVVTRIDIVVESDDAVHEKHYTTSAKKVEVQDRNEFVSSVMDPKFKFESFTCGASNKMAYIASQNIADFNSCSFGNTLFICGGVGMGKTHLLQSILASVNKHYPEKLVGYLSAEKFMHHYMRAVRSNELIRFKENLRALDVLLFDDLQFICDKASTQKEFANTVNALIESNKRVVIACDRSPYRLELDPRTKSRLSSGVVAEIQQADFSLRIKILQQKASMTDVAIGVDILQFLADNISSNIRELEGSLNKLVTYCNLNEMPINLETCKNTLKDCLKAHECDISTTKIVQAIADLNGVTKAEILSKSRLAKLVYLRQMAAYLARELTKSSLHDIGKHLGGKDHATIIYCIRQFEQKLERTPAIMEEVNAIKHLVNANMV